MYYTGGLEYSQRHQVTNVRRVRLKEVESPYDECRRLKRGTLRVTDRARGQRGQMLVCGTTKCELSRRLGRTRRGRAVRRSCFFGLKGRLGWTHNYCSMHMGVFRGVGAYILQISTVTCVFDDVWPGAPVSFLFCPIALFWGIPFYGRISKSSVFWHYWQTFANFVGQCWWKNFNFNLSKNVHKKFSNRKKRKKRALHLPAPGGVPAP